MLLLVLNVGVALTVIATVLDEVQPFEAVPTTVYVVLFVAVVTTEVPVVLLNAVAGLQL